LAQFRKRKLCILWAVACGTPRNRETPSPFFIERAAPLSDKRGVNCGWARIGNWPGYKTIFTTSIGGDPLYKTGNEDKSYLRPTTFLLISLGSLVDFCTICDLDNRELHFNLCNKK